MVVVVKDWLTYGLQGLKSMVHVTLHNSVPCASIACAKLKVF
jgi:hypothetical protein